MSNDHHCDLPSTVADTCPAAPVDMSSNPPDASEALIQFLYQAPIGLVQMNCAGEIEMLNSMSAQLLMPLASEGNLDNLYTVLEGVAPQLRGLADAFGAASGTVCESLRVAPPVRRPSAAQQILSISVLKIAADRLICVLLDATEQVRREQRDIQMYLAAESRIDALTRLPNRAAIRERLQQAIDRAGADPRSRFAILYLDCDRFGRINDADGTMIGDKLLVQIADRLRGSLRMPAAANSIGSMPARMGSDEFVVLVEGDVDCIDAEAMARQLIEALYHAYTVDGRRLHSSVSIGLLHCAEFDGSADAALHAAHLAMLQAKVAGGAQLTVFEPAMQMRAARQGTLEVDLHHALAAGQLFLVYQPVVALQSGAVRPASAGVEALVRWRHPTLGIVPPLEFIGIAESSGLIASIGQFVLNAACRQFGEWRTELGPDAPRTMAVNLSRAQLLEGGFVAAVGQILSRNRMDAACLQLEVTESLAAQDELVQRRLHELKALGLTLALDDFGTGYSSLASLHLLPVDTVKVDRSFVSLAATSPHHRVLIDATVRVARSLGMATVAEGVEDEEQARIVRDLGCDKGQGYLYSRPLAPDDITLWLRAAAPATIEMA